MSIVFKEARRPDREPVFRDAMVRISEESHRKIKEISIRCGWTQKEVADKLIGYALENVEWE